MIRLLRWGYGYVHYIVDNVFSSWPLSWLFRYKQITAGTETVVTVCQIIEHMYQLDKGDCKKTEDEILTEILGLNFMENIFEIRDDMYGLNLFQHAIIVNKRRILEALLDKIPQNLGVGCNSPTHMAAALGHTDILNCLIINRPFDLYKRAGLCYPDLHEPVSNHRRLGFRFTDVYRCEEEKLLPVEWAISNDHVESVKEIVRNMKDMGGRRYSLPRFLHFAASRGAEKCLHYFVSICPQDINHVSKSGDVPLLEAIVWGRQCAKVLIDNGANVTKVAENGDSALHRLYRNDIDGIFAIYDTTKYLLDTGIEQQINTINHKGETALHLLVTHVSYIGGNYYRPEQRSRPRGEMQPDYQEQVIKTIKLLLGFNADPHIYDSLQLQPLNKLLHVTMKASRPNDKLKCVQDCINSKYIYRNDFKSLARAMSVLIENGAEVNTQCSIGHTPLILLVQTLLCTNIPDLVHQGDAILRAITLLLGNGARCNFISEDHKTCCSLLADLAKKILQNPTRRRAGEQDSDIKQKYCHFVNDILIMFLKHGLNPNYTTTKKSPHLSGGSGNALIEFVRLTIYASTGDDFQMILVWLKTLFQWGADPDIEAYPSDPIICHSQSSIFLKKQSTQALSHYIYEVKELQAIFENGHAEELLMLFYMSMDHKVLYDCLTTACFMTRFHPLGATGQNFLSMLNRMTEQPRTLKQMARVAIYKAVDRKLSTSVEQLPLPTALKQYLLNIE